MPKEIIPANVVEHDHVEPSGKAGFRIDVRLGVHVGWQNEQGKPQIAIVGWPHNPPDELDLANVQIPGYYADLTWNGCNDLIRAIRRARDAAFGRPE